MEQTVTLPAEEWQLVRIAMDHLTQEFYDIGEMDLGNTVAKVYHAVAKQTGYDE